jgi:hypothetical protein
MRRCSLVLAPRAVWCRPLSVDKSPSLMTYAAGFQIPNQAGKCGVGQLAMTRPADCVVAQRLLHSITSSARASSICGISRPSALAVFRLITSSNSRLRAPFDV